MGEAMRTDAALVLVVEDDDDLREIEASLLRRAGFRVGEARDGREALSLVEQEMPRLIFLDMRMPHMDGWAFASEFHARHGRSVPVVVVTAASNAQRWADEIAAEGAIGKPFEARVLLETAERLVPA
jgi:CheY-like chemotaxis protein